MADISFALTLPPPFTDRLAAAALNLWERTWRKHDATQAFSSRGRCGHQGLWWGCEGHTLAIQIHFGLCSAITSARLRSRMCSFGYCSTAASNAARATLPQRDCQPVEVGGDDQSGLAARQREHRAVLIGQHDRARTGGPDRGAHAARGIDAINIRRPSDVADDADEIGH